MAFHGISWLILTVIGNILGDEDCPSLYDENTSAHKAMKTGAYDQDRNCFLDCTRNDELDVACESIQFPQLVDTIKRIPHLNDRINLFLWSSPYIIELESGIFSPIKNEIRSLTLMGMPNLINFPMLRELKNLETLKIEDALSLNQFSPEILPKSIRKLVLILTGITQLTADLQEVTPLDQLTSFVFMQHSIFDIGAKFFDIFPKVTSVTISENNLSLTSIAENSFFTQLGLNIFIFRNNNFNQSSQSVRQTFIEVIMENLNTANYSSVDLTSNGLPITKDAAAAFPQISNVQALSLAGNGFGQFFDSSGLFTGFDSLTRLDVSNTRFPKQKGILRGLSSLKLLNLAQNEFRDLSRIDIFQGCRGKIEILDLSDNHLMALPTADSFRNLTGTISTLILSGNQFHSELLDLEDENMPSPVPATFDFTSLTFLDLSKTNLTTFKGTWLKAMTSLQKLDLSCNSIKRVTTTFFTGMPASLETLDFSFCVNTMPESPKVEPDAFTTLGLGGGLKSLRLAGGYFKSWMFTFLMKMPVTSRKRLETLDLSRNQIRYLARASLDGYTDLKTLNIGENFIQTIGKQTFSGMTSLRSLNLSSNFIVSVQNDELIDLENLEFLDLSNNGLRSIANGSFDTLTRLEYLYLGRNLLSGYIGMFTYGGQNLVHLGLQRNPNLTLTTYPAGCIDRKDLQSLSNLLYFYIDNSTTVFVDHGRTVRSIEEKIKETPVAPGDHFKFQCHYGGIMKEPTSVSRAVPEIAEPGGVESWSDDFFRTLISDPTDLAPRSFIGLIPKCYSPWFKFLANVTTNFVCPTKDSKTYDPATDKKATS